MTPNICSSRQWSALPCICICICVCVFTNMQQEDFLATERESHSPPLSPTFPSSCRIHEERVKPSGLASTSTYLPSVLAFASAMVASASFSILLWLLLPSYCGFFCLSTDCGCKTQCRDFQAAVKLGRPNVSLARGKALQSQVPQMSEHSQKGKVKVPELQCRNKRRA